MTNRLYTDIHILQALPPRCVSRGDICSLQTAVYGGVNRYRIDPHVWKNEIQTLVLNMEASCQIAHAISTHQAHDRVDYFAEADKQETEPDTGKSGINGYSSCTLYRYATIAIHALCRQIGNTDTAANYVRAFTEVFTRSMPAFTDNTCVTRSPSDTVYVTIRTDQPLNHVGAFERPVKTSDRGYIKASADALVKKANESKTWVSRPLVSLALSDLMSGIEDVMIMDSLDELLSRLEREVEDALQ
jgi:CRISPR system Cascade subunit CasC